MNINLMVDNKSVGTIQDRIDGHRDVMEKAGFPIRDGVCLIAEKDVPGSYQVWLESDHPDDYAVWYHVTPDGVVIEAENPV